VAISRSDIVTWLVEEFSSRLTSVFEIMAGERLAIDSAPAAEMPADAALRWRQPLKGLPGAAWVVASDASWGAAGGYVLRAAGIDETDPASLKSTYLETISQALSGLADGIGTRLGGEVTCVNGEETAPAPEGEAAWFNLQIKLGTDTAIVGFGLEAALLASILAEQEQPPAAPAAPEAQAAAAGAPSSPAHPTSKTFDLLLDVELPVSVSFGRAQVQLKDVLKLTTGSIVELNRSIFEPVEVIVNNCIIARGEVVVVEGNFGVRIQQVISRQERLRTLH
jgi:flagellar motor switch protein FliN/FliY